MHKKNKKKKKKELTLRDTRKSKKGEWISMGKFSTFKLYELVVIINNKWCCILQNKMKYQSIN